jgi:hypothetical protein
MKNITVLAMAFLFALCSCSPKKELNTVTFDEMQPTDPYTVYISTGPCLGACPEYQMEIDHKGVLKYVGKRNVPLIGEAQNVLGESDLLQLKKQLLNLQIHSLDSAYTCNIADLPEVVLTFKIKKQRKTVYVVCEAPEKVTDFIGFIDKLRVSYMPAEVFVPLSEEQ